MAAKFAPMFGCRFGNLRRRRSPGVIKPTDELPDGFGHAEVVGKRVMIVLLSLLRRIGQNAPEGCSIKCYTHQTKGRTVLEMDTDCRTDTLDSSGPSAIS